MPEHTSVLFMRKSRAGCAMGGGRQRVVFNDGYWYLVEGPQTQPVVVFNPVPRVVERRSLLSPTIERDGDTIRLTRPQLQVP